MRREGFVSRSLARRSIALVSLLTTGLLAAYSTQARADDAALLIAPSELFSGGRSSLTVTTIDSKDRSPIERPVTVTLERGEEIIATLFTGSTRSDGRAQIDFEVPSLEPGSYAIEARVTGIAAPVRVTTSVTNAPAILIETDKPIYKPSQTIQGRIVLLDNSLRPTPGEVELSIHDAKGIRIDRRTLTASDWGAARFELPLASEVNFGVWQVKARSGNVESVRDIRVEEYTLPRFELGVSFEKSWALVDESVSGRIDARYFFGRDVEGEATVIARRWVGSWEEYHRSTGELSSGAYEFTLPPVGFVAGAPGQEGQGEVTIDVTVTDSTGHEQTTTEILTITQAPIVLGLVPRSHTAKPGLPLDVLITARTPEGEPIDASVDVTATWLNSWGGEIRVDRTTVAVASGLGDVTFEPPPEMGWVELVASSARDGRTATARTRVNGSYSSGHGFISLGRIGPNDAASVGEVVTFSVDATHPGTTYYEVYAGGRTVLSGASETGSFSFPITASMAPRARVIAYQIQPDNEVSADRLELDVELASTIQVSADFSAEEIRPGDLVELTIDAGTGERTLLGVSLVDRSVLALGRSRLHLAEVFSELERRFLEPKVEVHHDPQGGDDIGGGGPAPGGGIIADAPFFRAPRSDGALDVLKQSGYVVAASSALRIPSGEEFWARDDVAEAGPPVPGAADEEASSAPDSVRVRQYFPETWVWEPLLLTDENGRASLELTAPDSITSWELAVVGTSPQGIGFGTTGLTVFQEFFVEPSLPVAVTRGEEFPVKVDIFNYLDETQTVELTFANGEWFELLGEDRASVTVPANAAISVSFPIRPTLLGEHEIELTARGSSRADAVRRVLRVDPEGVPSETVQNGVIEAGTSVVLDTSTPPNIVSGSLRCFLNVTPSPVAQTMQGVSDLLSMPYGCGEQNMIFLAPDVEILKYLREIGELTPEIRATAEYYVNVGYQRQLTFQTTDGGFAAFGGEEGSLWLTAFVLSTFSGAREVRDIDEAVLERAAGMLVSRQKSDGSFQTDDFLIHQEMDGGLSNIYAMAAYVTKALAEHAEGGTPPGDVTTAITRAASYLRANRSDVHDDAYALSIAANALLDVPGFEDTAEEVIDRLLELAIEDGPGIHWEPYPVETTGYAAMALLRSGRHQAQPAIDYLTTTRNALGGYGESTQDTVVAIRALFLAAREVRRDLDLTLELVAAGGSVIGSTRIDASNFDILHTLPLPCAEPSMLPIELRATGKGSVSWQVASRYNVPAVTLPPSRDLEIDVTYRTESIEIDETVTVYVRLLYTGAKEKTAMVIADIGVPTGFAPERPSLDQLIENKVVSRAEVAGRKVIFYIDHLTRDVPL
ncbi:MAG TPA: alpha-2-macroglobulin family protein, partial [Planctomycetota bacterium]|nr:alpha-2-macroglobulin family protein [Planctomycetota bacterium]